MPPNEAAGAFLPAPAARLPFDGSDRGHAERLLPVETPVQIVFAPMPYAVMMASPIDLEDFAYGFSLTEGVIERVEDIRAVEIAAEPRGRRVTITLVGDRLRAQLARSRAMAGRTGCGVCGVEDFDSIPMARTPPRRARPLEVAAIRAAVRGLDDRLPLGAATRATHAAAWCDESGAIRLAREDVGRHNALDKLIGALLRRGEDATRGFILVTSRCSFEMVEKAAAFGAGAIVAISAPTTLALERARAHGMTLVAVARADGALLFTDAAGVSFENLREDAKP